jgi:uncharacterized protein (UPF0276 family)
MKIGCNYSKQLLELIEEDEVSIDYIKIGDFGPFKQSIDEAFLIKPLLIHGFGFYEHAGMKMNIDIDWDIMNERLIKYESPHLGLHFSLYKKDMNIYEDENKTISRMVATLKIWSNNIEIPLLIENIDYCPYYTNRLSSLKLVSKPEVITQVCEEVGIDLLLDIAHAKVSAYHLNQNIYDYIDSLPLHKVKEIHITGTEMKQDIGIIDSHLQLVDEDYKILNYVLSKSNPQILTLEYGWPGEEYAFRTKKEMIKLQLNKLKQLAL